MTSRLVIPFDLALPFWRYGAMFSSDSCAFLLDSALAPERLGRYSFLGGDPCALLTGRRTGRADLAMELTLASWRQADGVVIDSPAVREWTGDPFAALRDLQRGYRTGLDSGMPPGGHFQSGLVGYFGYETGYAIENLPDTGDDDLQLPDLAFMVVDEVLCHDHRTGQTTLSIIDRGDSDARVSEWRIRIAAFEADADGQGAGTPNSPGRLEGSGARMAEEPGSRAGRSHGWRRPAPPEIGGAGSLPVRAHFNKDEYCAAVQECRDHIFEGDVFEVCLTHRLEMDLPGDPWELFGILREINPAPFASWLQFPDFQVVSASPERFLSLGEDRTAESRPIKGTRPRGKDAAEDTRLRDELAASKKDRAENVMIVDLVRNDLGRVAEIGSVEVPELQIIEEYATVFQMVSTVRARLRDDRDAFDLVRACFPGGSMTGAPKIEAMKIIDAIEPVKRGVYSGAIGYFDHGGSVDLSIVIRAIVCKDGRATFGVGGAVVADSDPAAEYQETLDKARALITAVSLLAEQEGAS
ncbi:MAG: aminodeoxychorismate synthase component I [Candidatus Krumholzibacteriota bacterium]